jgi:hypothetical protein
MRRYELGTVRGEIPLAINWNVVRQHRQQEIMSEQQELLDKRNAAIFRAALSGLDSPLKEFSLQVAKSAYPNAVESEPLKEQDSLLLQEIDALKDEKMAVADYIDRARAIYSLAHPLTRLQVTVTPKDATITLTPAEDPNRAVSPSSPNIYEVQAGQYRLSAQYPGYAPYARELSLAVEDKTLNVALERLMGTLNLRVQPADAKVTLAPIRVLAPDNQMVQFRAVTVQTTEQRRLPVGTYQVTAEKEGYERSVRDNIEIKANMDIQVTITLKPSIIISPGPLRPRSRALMPLFSLVLPGSGQYYGRRYGSGTFFLLTGLGAAVAFAAGYQAYSSSVDEYNESIRRYNDALDPHEVESAKQAMLDAEDNADTKFLLRQTALATLVGIWAANVLHAYIAGPSTAASPPYVEADEPGWNIVPRVAPDAAAIVVRHPL